MLNSPAGTHTRVMPSTGEVQVCPISVHTGGIEESFAGVSAAVGVGRGVGILGIELLEQPASSKDRMVENNITNDIFCFMVELLVGAQPCTSPGRPQGCAPTPKCQNSSRLMRQMAMPVNSTHHSAVAMIGVTVGSGWPFARYMTRGWLVLKSISIFHGRTSYSQGAYFWIGADRNGIGPAHASTRLIPSTGPRPLKKVASIRASVRKKSRLR